MDIPSTASQLIIALLLVTPGAIYQITRSRLRGPTPDDASATNRILRALGFSAGLNAIYAIVGGPQLYGLISDDETRQLSWTGALSNLRSIGWLALLLYVAVPALLAGAGALATKYLPRVRQQLKLPRLSYDPTPRAWDAAFARQTEPCYVRVLTTDGRWVGGYFSGNGFVSSYPEPADMFVDEAWLMSDDGEFLRAQPNSRGMYVRCDDIRTIEFIDSQPDTSDTQSNAPSGDTP